MGLHLEGLALVLPALALRWVLNTRVNPKKPNAKMVKSILMTITCLICGLGIAYSLIGDMISWSIHAITGMNGALAIGIPLTLVIVTAGVVIADVTHDKNADRGAQMAAMLAPTMLALVIAGSIGASTHSAVQSSYDVVHAQIAHMSGTR
jgi:cytochrome c oxidase subunit IV